MLRNAVSLLRSHAFWDFRQSLATGAMFAAYSPLGRSLKIVLFVVGVILPLGSLIWAMLMWHGHRFGKKKTEA